MGPLPGGAPVGLGQTLVRSPYGSSGFTGIAFTAECALFYLVSGISPSTIHLGTAFLLGTAGYLFLRSPLSMTQWASVGMGLVGGALYLLCFPWNISAWGAMGIWLAYRRYLRPIPGLKSLSIVAAWLCALHALTGFWDAPLYRQQGYLLLLLTLPPDIATLNTDTILTLPRWVGKKLTLLLAYSLLALYGWETLSLSLPLQIAGGGTLLYVGTLLSWPESFQLSALLWYDSALILQALLFYLTLSVAH